MKIIHSGMPRSLMGSFPIVFSMISLRKPTCGAQSADGVCISETALGRAKSKGLTEIVSILRQVAAA